MLGKLIKYDLKWVYKIIGVFYLLSLVFSVIGRSLSYFQNSIVFQIVSQISFGIAIAMMVNCLINNLMRMWVRFVRNIYKDESYLTHTLPLSKQTIYLAKLLSGIISLFTTIIVILLCIAICFYTPENMQALKAGLEIAASSYHTTVVSFLLMVGIVFFLEMVFTLLIGYIGIILGHRANNNKMVKSVLWAIGLYFGSQACILLILFVVGFFQQNIMNLFTSANQIDVQAIKTIMYVGIGIYLVYLTIYYFMGKKFFEKGVNIE